MNQSPPDLAGVVVLRRELLAEDYTDYTIRALVRSGALVRVRRGAYVDGDLWASLDASDRHRVLVRAVLKTAHPTAVVTHISAAIEHGAPVWGVRLDEVHITRSDGRAGRREAGVVQHRGELDEADIEDLNAIKVSSAARAAIEVCTITTVERALVIVNGLLHRGNVSTSEIVSLAKRLDHWPGSLSTNVVLRLADGRMESVAETRTDFLCWSQRLPRPAAQVGVHDESGHEFARVDFVWIESGVFLEFDGRIKYEKYRRAGETLEQFLMREKRREERICQLTGWVCIRITWADLEYPAATASRIRNLLASRRPAGA